LNVVLKYNRLFEIKLFAQKSASLKMLGEVG
jgi:hypothetical protein